MGAVVMHKFAIDARAWAELNQLLDAALDQPASQRDHWLDTLAPDFDALKPHLRDLLSRAGGVETGDFLTRCRSWISMRGNGRRQMHGSINPATRSDPIASCGSSAAEEWERCGWRSAWTA